MSLSMKEIRKIEFDYCKRLAVVTLYSKGKNHIAELPFQLVYDLKLIDEPAIRSICEFKLSEDEHKNKQKDL